MYLYMYICVVFLVVISVAVYRSVVLLAVFVVIATAEILTGCPRKAFEVKALRSACSHHGLSRSLSHSAEMYMQDGMCKSPLRTDIQDIVPKESTALRFGTP